MTDQNWVNDLKPGDKVYVPGKYGGFGWVAEVERVTPTQIVVAGHGKFKRGEGFAAGRSIGRGAWDTVHIRQLTPEVEEKHRIHMLKNKANSLRNEIGTPDGNEEQLRRFVAALQTAYDVYKECQA